MSTVVDISALEVKLTAVGLHSEMLCVFFMINLLLELCKFIIMSIILLILYIGKHFNILEIKL